MIFRIILGLATVFFGSLFVVKTESFLNNFGRIGFFENHLATSGGSRLGYKLIGVFLIVMGFMITTGLISGFINWLISPLTKYQ